MKKKIINIICLIDFIYYFNFQLFSILDVTANDCQDALLVEMKDYEDAVISCCAKRSQMDYIITRNIKDYKYSKIKTIVPDDFIQLISQNEV